jgi:predicted dithiol-disulfide oxidoreductase (DUF899 family)
MKKKFSNGSVLYTGDDITKVLLESFNRRNDYNNRDCSFCIHEDSDNEYCDGCSVIYYEGGGCHCHINPPCSFCENNSFEPSPYLINYKHHKNWKWKWECFKSTKEVYDKLTSLEEQSFILSAETLTTGEIAIYLENDDYGEDIEICNKSDFKKTVNEFIINFNHG